MTFTSPFVDAAGVHPKRRGKGIGKITELPAYPAELIFVTCQVCNRITCMRPNSAARVSKDKYDQEHTTLVRWTDVDLDKGSGTCDACSAILDMYANAELSNAEREQMVERFPWLKQVVNAEFDSA